MSFLRDVNVDCDVIVKDLFKEDESFPNWVKQVSDAQE